EPSGRLPPDSRYTPPPMVQKEAMLEAQVRAFLPQIWEEAPDLATVCGAHAWDSRLPRPDADSAARRSELYGALLTEVEEHRSASLHARHDIEVFEARLAAWRYAALELKLWKRNPDALSGLGSLLFTMLIHRPEDPDTHFAAVAARCRAIPDYLETFRGRLDLPERIWVDTAVRVCRSTGPLFDALLPSAQAAGAAGSTLDDLADAADTARRASDDHRRWLEALSDAETMEGGWLLSDQAYGHLLDLKLLDLTIEEVEEIGREQLAMRVAQRDQHQPPSGPPPASFAQALERVGQIVSESRRFVLDRQFAAIPSKEELVIQATPSFLRPVIPFAALLSSGPLESVQRSVYLVSEPADGDLSELRPARIGGVAVHEGYPGHHLQLTTANQTCSLLRSRFIGSPGCNGEAALGVDLIEGWAHYCEEQMQEAGYGCLPGAAWVLRNDQVWRAVRILVDVGMCRGRMSPEEAVGLLVEQAGLSRPGAEAEVRRYTSNPTYQLCYLIGKEKLSALRRELLQTWGQEGSPRRFHDLVLAAGCIPVEMLRRFEREERENPGGSC
ncbi:MAG: DUF885 domain-containing protein, partial [Myxococcota bacterium]|nr:DUF885 domain-containing protein [Myxococcota bacterium]